MKEDWLPTARTGTRRGGRERAADDDSECSADHGSLTTDTVTDDPDENLPDDFWRDSSAMVLDDRNGLTSDQKCVADTG